jgi:hypothetical protein
VELWLVRDVPAWLVGIALIVGLPLAVLGLDVLIHRTMSHRRLDPHNAVTGVIVSVVGVAYAIVIGLCVVSLWDGYTAAEDTVRDEAVNLTALVPASAVFDATTQRRITEDIVRYEKDLVTDWNARHDEGLAGDRVADLGRLTGTIGALQPSTEAQKAFVHRAVDAVARAEQYRHESRAEADDQRMADVMWIGVLISTAAILGMCLFFGLSDELLRRILLTLSSAVIATNLFLIVEMNYPYYGSFSVTPTGYERTIAELEQGR